VSSFVTIASRAARAAGEIIIRGAGDLHRVRTRRKGDRDLVSEIDLRAEARITQILNQALPEHAVRGEESGAGAVTEARYEWLVDPLDGTRNFLHGLPYYSISIALLDRGRLECGVVFDPLRGELFEVTRGEGATLNDRRIRVAEAKHLEEAVIATGSPPVKGARAEQVGRVVTALSCGVGGVRQTGSAALDLAYVACGRLNGVVYFGLQPWDSAAGALLVQEAGGMVSDFDGKAEFLKRGDLLSGNPAICQALLSVVKEHATES